MFLGATSLQGLVGGGAACVRAFPCAQGRAGRCLRGWQSWMLLERSLLVTISRDPLNWKIWFEEAAGAPWGLRGRLSVSPCPLSASEEHLRGMRAARESLWCSAPRTPDWPRWAPGDSVAVSLADSSNRAKPAQPPVPGILRPLSSLRWKHVLLYLWPEIA